MKVKIPVYKTTRVLETENEFELPDEESYYFETGVRRSIRFVPIWTTWKHEKGEPEIIYQYHITAVYLSFESKVEAFTVSALSGLIDLYKDSDKSVEGYIIKSLWKGWLNTRTKEQFEEDLNMCIQKIKTMQ